MFVRQSRDVGEDVDGSVEVQRMRSGSGEADRARFSEEDDGAVRTVAILFVATDGCYFGLWTRGT